MDNHKKHTHWTEEQCKEEANKYSTSTEWAKKSPASYRAAIRHNWKEKFIKKENIWTLESCKKEASKYSRSTEWRSTSPTSYNRAAQMGWLEECKKYFKN